MSQIAPATSNVGMHVCWFSSGCDGAWPKRDPEMGSVTAISLRCGIGTDQIAIIASVGPSHCWTAARCTIAPIAAPPTNPHSNPSTT
jgi:hypothetical protein